MPPFGCGWPTSSRGIQVRSSRTVPAAPCHSITCLPGSGVVGRQLDGAAVGPQTKHSLERVAAESLWLTRRESSPQQAERPRDAGLLYPMTKSEQNELGRGRPPWPHSRLAADAEPAEQQIIDRYLSGLSLRQAGKPFGAGPGTVTGVLDRHGIARRRVGRPRQRLSTAALLAVGDEDRFLRAREVTAVLGVSRRTTYRLIGSGELKAVRVSPRGVRVRESVLRAYLLSRQAPAPGVVDPVSAHGAGIAASRIGQAALQADVDAPYLQVGPVIVRLTGEIATVGRGDDCRIHLNDPSVALLHAELVCRGLCVSVTALVGPIGTTTVNGQAVTRHVLTDGDVINFGQVACTVGGLAAHAVLE
jgi:excisionase family DNA binding protein